MAKKRYIVPTTELSRGLDTICVKCKRRFGQHYGYSCYGGDPKGKNGVFSKYSSKPLESKVAASSTSTNNSYTAALRERVNRYFPNYSSRSVECFIKSVQRLNVSKAKHCA